MLPNDVSVVIPVYNALPVLRLSLSILLHSGVAPECILLEDDGSSGPHCAPFATWAARHGLAWAPAGANVGYTRAVNRAIARTSTPYVLLMNSDCFIHAGTIRGLADVLARQDGYAVVGPISNNAAHQTANFEIGVTWDALKPDEVIARILQIETRLGWEFGSRPFFSPSVNGFCALWRRSILDEIGGFDEALFPRGYGEEDDACFRAIEHGYLPMVAPHLFAVHLRTQSFSAAEKNDLKADAVSKLDQRFGPDFRGRVNKYFEKSRLVHQLLEGQR